MKQAIKASEDQSRELSDLLNDKEKNLNGQNAALEKELNDN